MPNVDDVPRTATGEIDADAVREEATQHIDFCTSYERVQAELQAKAPEYQGRAQRLRLLQGIAIGAGIDLAPPEPNRAARRSTGRTTPKKR